MDYLIYSISIEKTTVQLIINSLGYCVCILKGIHTDMFVNSSLDESMDKMRKIINLLELAI